MFELGPHFLPALERCRVVQNKTEQLTTSPHPTPLTTTQYYKPIQSDLGIFNMKTTSQH